MHCAPASPIVHIVIRQNYILQICLLSLLCIDCCLRSTELRHCRIILFVIFIEAPLFTRLVADYLSEDEYAAMQWALAMRPEAGQIIPGSGGIRKLRWSGSGRGKRGGLRVIYYWRQRAGEIWLLTLYAKNEAADIPLEALKRLRREIES